VVIPVLVTLALFQSIYDDQSGDPADFHEEQSEMLRSQRLQHPRFRPGGNVTVYWDAIPFQIRQVSFKPEKSSNIRPQDYIGPDSCRKCHQEIYDNWSQHPHRWMNALAEESTVKGDFSDKAGIRYLGGQATFYQRHGQYRMQLERDNVHRVYEINQTIGSRFFQYYVGKGLEGPEPAGHDFYENDHVLPFGFWLEERMWVPIVHMTHREPPDDRRLDPFDPPRQGIIGPAILHSEVEHLYANCNYCHTTFSWGDLCMRFPRLVGRHAPVSMSLLWPAYLAESRPALWDGARQPWEVDNQFINQLIETVTRFEAPKNAVTLGISCEACHLGAKEHALGKRDRPEFLPRSPHLFVADRGVTLNRGRTHANLNWVCSRCHSGKRPQFAAGMGTWNSTEFSDAMRGSCYSELTCVSCHNPHLATGPKWSRTAQQDDALCLKCHQKFEPIDAQVAHTHHPVQSEGARCMNCHMPRINEGLQDVVRTHMIYSPTQRDMIEANHPNACNLCHLDRTIDWTVQYLGEWYQAEYAEAQLDANYPQRAAPVGRGWLKHEHESVRLVAAAAIRRRKAMWALPDLIDALDDQYLLNRQFAQKGLQDMLQIRLEDQGYRFYMTRDERREPLKEIRAKFLTQP
jgi:predicted CXXCH cytochrome family protein